MAAQVWKDNRPSRAVFSGQLYAILKKRPSATPTWAHADSCALIFCTVTVPTPNLVAILRMPASPFLGALRIALSVFAPAGRAFALCAGVIDTTLDPLSDHGGLELCEHSHH